MKSGLSGGFRKTCFEESNSADFFHFRKSCFEFGGFFHFEQLKIFKGQKKRNSAELPKACHCNVPFQVVVEPGPEEEKQTENRKRIFCLIAGVG